MYRLLYRYMPAGSLTLVAAPTKPAGRAPKMGRYSTVTIPNKKKLHKVIRKRAKAQGINKIYPSRLFTTLVWEFGQELTSSIVKDNFGTGREFFVNDLRNPILSSSVRPQGFDQMAVAYERYKVFGAKFEFTYSNPSQDGLQIAHRLHKSTDTGAYDLTGQTLSSAGMFKWTNIKPMNDSGDQIMHHNVYANVAAIEGLTKGQLNGDFSEFSAAFASGGPNYAPRVETALMNTVDTTAAKVYQKLRVTFYVQCYNRKILPTSTA